MTSHTKFSRSKVLAALAAGSCAIAFAGCGESTPHQMVVVLIDRSKSTAPASIRGHYLKSFKTIVGWLSAEGGRIVGDGIDASSLEDSRQPIDAKFVTGDFNSNPLKVKHDNAQATNSAIDGAKTLIYGPRSKRGGTEILDGLEVAQHLFDKYPDFHKRYLVIFSDMIEESDRLHFTKLVLTEDGTRQFIKHDRDRHLLPDLGGVNVYVVGVGTAFNNTVSSERFHDIRAFWIDYLNAAGADLSTDNYGPSLIQFP